MVKKYITQLKNKQGLVALLVVIVAGFVSIGITSATMQKKTEPSVSKATSRSSQTTKQVAAPTPSVVKGESTTQPVTSPLSTPTQKADPTSSPTTSGTPKKAAATPSPSSSPALAPSPAINLTVGILTFDNYSNPPTVTFSIPATTNVSGSVTMVVTKDDNKATLCSQTLAFTAGETKNMQCGYIPTVAPNRIYATVSEGSMSVRPSTDAWDGYVPN